MSSKSAFLFATLLALAVASVPAARADYFYNFSPITNPTALSDHSGMGITINNQPQVGPIATGLNTNVVAATLSTFINPGVTGTDTFNTGQSSTIQLTITDGTQHATANFGLKFSGSLSASNSQIGVTFDNGQTTETKTLTVNGNQYSIVLNSIVPPGIPGAPPGTVGGVPGAIPGSIGGQILAGLQVGGGGGGTTTPPSSAPEPSTLVLSSLGAAFFGMGGWRTWRRRRTIVV
jgi:hypothetical protein